MFYGQPIPINYIRMRYEYEIITREADILQDLRNYHSLLLQLLIQACAIRLH